MYNLFLKTLIPRTARNLLFVFSFSVLCSSFLFAQTTDLSYSYHSIHYKGNAQVSFNGQSYNCQYNYVNVIDSFMYIQLNMGPIEAGRILITPDNVLFINKLQQNYYDGDYSFFQHFTGLEIDFYTFQAIFNGFPVPVPDEVELSYQGKTDFGEYSFFNTLSFETEEFALALDVKKVTFNDVPKVSATVPKNYSTIKF